MIRVHSYESMGTFDGPGLRLVVFLQGCNFKCAFCANPDTIAFEGGKETDPQEILDLALSQKAFFGRRGGITFSGGEPMLQARQLLPLFRQLKEHDIHIVVDTNGSFLNDDVKALLEHTDMVLLDVKAVDETKHRHLTEARNINVRRMAEYLERQGIPMRLRCVMVPGYNDSPEDIRLIGEQYSGFTNIDRVEVLPYHTFGVHKYKSLGWVYRLEGLTEHAPEEVALLFQEFEKYFPLVWAQS
ncbi:pyruvate formate-lyase-activating protein [Porphyromonas levii]|uniref:Pyruvate formate-lyase-activating enzyme n=1 Tax=Porphyromonas levii TaxID=28114 RepID=A0A4Y8WQB4_9PORP|nr:pyruvate formate-lyase-activating protein [Porphyromonas levii]TFH95680.1 pyruvate formate lyase-activating protein [Porphyromonas levii]TFH96349.1 pyruvate formate lyase-activating protein [Porphyromonas levii]